LPCIEFELGPLVVKWLLKAVLTLPDLPRIYSRFAEMLAGKDGLRTVRAAFERDGIVPDFVVTDDPSQPLTFSATC
jgi:hypothetical protein